jgi:hypothetical protein
MSPNQQEPDMLCGLFILDPTDLVDNDELPTRGLGRNRPS